MTTANILIVDDDPDIRSNFADILAEFGYTIVTADSGESALDRIRQQDFDVVLFDYKMPGMDGATLYSEIKKLRPSVAAIMITAWAGSDGAERAKNAGTWEVLRKPVDIPELLEKLHHAANAPVVLLVDDDEDFCQSLWQLLNQRRFRVALAHTEAEGIARVHDSNCQIAIVDLKLGSGDGRRVIEQLRGSLPQAKTVLISGDKQNAAMAVEQLGDQMINAVCEKPIDIDRLISMIEHGAADN
jgi:DNA-binding NtrC family response regulator